MELNQYLQTMNNYNTEIVKFSATTIKKYKIMQILLLKFILICTV
jgi:hypothetical protein